MSANLQIAGNEKIVIGSNQPYLFPYIGYWQLMNLADTYVISDSMKYINKGYINRNNILLNGKAHLFTLQVLGVHEHTLINEVSVGKNARKIAITISHAYKKAPHFNEVFPMIESILLNTETNLAKYIGHSIQEIASYLDMKTAFVYLTDLQGETTLKSQDRTVDICKRAHATHYVNAIGGQHLYDQESFQEEGISLSFLQTKDINYKQYYNEFIPNLSIIDVLMFNAKAEAKELLNDYSLIKCN